MGMLLLLIFITYLVIDSQNYNGTGLSAKFRSSTKKKARIDALGSVDVEVDQSLHRDTPDNVRTGAPVISNNRVDEKMQQPVPMSSKQSDNDDKVGDTDGPTIKSDYVINEIAKSFVDRVLYPLEIIIQYIPKKDVDEYIFYSRLDKKLTTNPKSFAMNDPRLEFYLILEQIQEYFKSLSIFGYTKENLSFKLKLSWSDLLFNFSPGFSYFEGPDSHYKNILYAFFENHLSMRVPSVMQSQGGEVKEFDCKLLLSIIALNNPIIGGFIQGIDSVCHHLGDDLSPNFFTPIKENVYASMYMSASMIKVNITANPMTYYNSQTIDLFKVINFMYMNVNMPHPSQVFILDFDEGSIKVEVEAKKQMYNFYSTYFIRFVKRYIDSVLVKVKAERLKVVLGGILPYKNLAKWYNAIDIVRPLLYNLNGATVQYFTPTLNKTEKMAYEDNSGHLSPLKIDEQDFLFSIDKVKERFKNNSKVLEDIEFQQRLMKQHVKNDNPKTVYLHYTDMSFGELDAFDLVPRDHYLQEQRSKRVSNKFIPQYFQEVILQNKHMNYDWRFFKWLHHSTEEVLYVKSKLIKAWFKFAKQIDIKTWISGNDYHTLNSWLNRHGILNTKVKDPVNVEISFESLIKLVENQYNYTIVYDATTKPIKINQTSILDLGASAFFLDISPYFVNRYTKDINWQNRNDARLIDVQTGIFININALVKNNLKVFRENFWDEVKLMKTIESSKAPFLNSVIEECVKDLLTQEQNQQPHVGHAFIDALERIECGRFLQRDVVKYQQELADDIKTIAQDPKVLVYNDLGNNYNLVKDKKFLIIPTLFDGILVYIPSEFERYLKINEGLPSSSYDSVQLSVVSETEAINAVSDLVKLHRNELETWRQNKGDLMNFKYWKTSDEKAFLRENPFLRRLREP